MTTPTTFRTDTRAYMYASLVAFKAAHPTLLPGVHTARPTSDLGDIPFAYVELLNETAKHDASLRMRTLAPSVVVVSRPLLNSELVAAWDTLVDLLADHFTTYAHFAPNTAWDQWTITDESETIGDEVYPIVRFTFGNVMAREGRL